MTTRALSVLGCLSSILIESAYAAAGLADGCAWDGDWGEFRPPPPPSAPPAPPPRSWFREGEVIAWVAIFCCGSSSLPFPPSPSRCSSLVMKQCRLETCTLLSTRLQLVCLPIQYSRLASVRRSLLVLPYPFSCPHPYICEGSSSCAAG